jgi:hypothetical protein
VAFLNWRFGLTQITAWRIEVPPFPDLSNVATPTKAIITIPIPLYGYGNGDDAEEGGPERRRDGQEHGEYKRDKARRYSRLVWPLGDRQRDMLQLHPATASRSPRAPGPRPACAGRTPRVALTVNAARVFATSALSTLQHLLHYFSEEVSRGKRGIRTSENTPSTHSGEEGSSVSLVHAHEVVCGGRSKLRVVG